jgi:hypothetical protein
MITATLNDNTVTFHSDGRAPRMSRKKLIKQLMTWGVPRNEAFHIALRANSKGIPYGEWHEAFFMRLAQILLENEIIGLDDLIGVNQV